jgi:hypothetical protein
MPRRANNDEFSQIKQVAERARPAAVPNEQIKQRSNFESSAKPRFITSKITLLKDEICPDMEAASIIIFSISWQYIPGVCTGKKRCRRNGERIYIAMGRLSGKRQTILTQHLSLYRDSSDRMYNMKILLGISFHQSFPLYVPEQPFP